MDSLHVAEAVAEAGRVPPPAPASTFGQRLRDARMKAGLSQKDVEQISGVSQQYVSLIEQDRHSPSLETASRLAEAVRRPLSDLMPAG